MTSLAAQGDKYGIVPVKIRPSPYFPFSKAGDILKFRNYEFLSRGSISTADRRNPGPLKPPLGAAGINRNRPIRAPGDGSTPGKSDSCFHEVWDNGDLSLSCRY